MEEEKSMAAAGADAITVKLLSIAPGYVRVTDVEKINFRKLFRDIDLHVDVGLKLYKAQRSETDSTFYGIFSKLKEYLDDTHKHQEKVSANVSK